MSKSCSLCISPPKPIPFRFFPGAELRPVGEREKASNPPSCKHLIPIAILLVLEIHKTLKCWDLPGAGSSALMCHTSEHMLPMPALTQRKIGQRPSPLPGISLPCQHQGELTVFSFGLCEMENTHRPGPPTYVAWMQHWHLWLAMVKTTRPALIFRDQLQNGSNGVGA